jgi:hypothetical protein
MIAADRESTYRWLNHFRRNARTLLPIPWELGAGSRHLT